MFRIQITNLNNSEFPAGIIY